MLTLSIPAVLSTSPLPASETRPVIAIITATCLNLRPAPDTTQPPIKQLEAGATVVIRGHHARSQWLNVMHEGDTGYIFNNQEYVYIIDKKFPVSPQPDFEILKKRQENLTAEIEKQSSAVQRYHNEEMNTVDALDRIDRRLQKLRHQISALQDAIVAAEHQLHATRAAITDLQRDINENEAYIARRLTALYKLKQLGMFHLLMSAGSLTDLLHRKRCLQRILDADLQHQHTLLQQKQQFNELQIRLKDQQGVRQAVSTDYQKQLSQLSTQRQKRSVLLQAIRDKNTIHRTIVEQLKVAAGQLEETLQQLLKRPSIPSKKENTNHSGSFSSYKGLLKMPVNGRIVAHFGPDKIRNNTVIFNSGIAIIAERGEPIHAVCDGIVQYSNWLKGYGNLIIIRHDDAYYTLYAHADELFKAQGDSVERGEVIATVGDTHSIEGPRLHFEVRHHSEALNPMEWLDNNG
jgi:septal ring factor EnvC (AmiA/AmiB activator)